MNITVLAGGVGGAKFLLGVKKYLGLEPFGPSPDGHPHQITAVVNTADDIRLHGVHIAADLDSCMYTLGGGADLERGWGRNDETWTTSAELAEYGGEAPWFNLGDKDFATHLMRTRMLDAGYPLSAVTQALCERWKPGVTLLPMTDERVETHVVVDLPGSTELVALHFQEWWIRYHAELPAMSITPIGAEQSRPGPGVLEAILTADLVLIAPSNPVVSIGTILAVPGIREALASTPAKIIGVSPIIGGAPVRGHADACLAAIGVETSAEGVGRHYGARSAGGLLDGWLIAEGDTAEIQGLAIGPIPLLMTDPLATAAMVEAAVAMAGILMLAGADSDDD
ncbi:2-phospho-L-lactate transferase [Nakamurella antarctica]|uniref:2-phospho-L-lactate transferase n=1 Tax=Nakamurella antarctica TaxID=1902245 RepID=A0A3G8ZMN3_9ACTN|nr:2-phospho-L-lactate transferase [Nakamurella antarctica]AZI58510.1 2-phospho-L-lactate transferase [Nakamurella antarctica]